MITKREPSQRIRSYYDRHTEADRFDSPHGRLELARTKAIISRYLPADPLRILDVGGGTGAYSFWLTDLGHEVAFVDLSRVQVELVRARDDQSQSKLASITVGHAGSLDFPPNSFDMVLNMGPMYHLPPGRERTAALQEMGRVLTDGGLLVSAYISRFAALMDGYRKSWVSNPVYEGLALADARTGVHDSPDDLKYYTLAYMHRPEEIRPELEASGYEVMDVVAVEGFFWTYPHLGELQSEPEGFARLLDHAEAVEREPSLMGASAHLLAIAIKGKGRRK